MTKKVLILPGDDAAPEAVLPALAALKSMELDIDFTVFPSGDEAMKLYDRETFQRRIQEAADSTDTTLFGATSGKTGGVGYLRWGKKTFANVRPIRWRPGFNSPLKRPEGIDFVIVRENLEDLYVGLEGELAALAPLGLGATGRVQRVDFAQEGRYAVKVITEANTRNVARFACELALKRKALGGRGKVTCACKYNVLPVSDGFFRRTVEEVVRGYPGLVYEQYIVDDFARRIVATPNDLDVVVMPNLYGDILSDEAAGIIGGLGLAPSGCYGDGYAYFESVHGTAPDIAGRHIINPTATLLSAVMMLEHLGFAEEASALDSAITSVYAEGRHLTPDQGGTSSSDEFCAAVSRAIR